jgi:3-deoxy-7-phosphoheptulonate synthase
MGSTESECLPNSADGSTKSSQVDPTLKTRHFVDIIGEITKSMRIHREKGTILGGVHLELTGEVNEDGFSVVGVIETMPAENRLNALADPWNLRIKISRSTIERIVIPA